ncbi:MULTISPECIES: hypothetical protein [unclassified Halomonas]|uniref:hypothetical protein n=1 Tax=unclassified Halomonas TaxID=2609666 RepID=UPI000990870D|nr:MULTISPECIES: hypothetical protein [unclassified Halomonas]AQU83120.1 hypothetical protein B2G49_11430 [Halomonas sp. 'Soap Lake \
MAIPRVRSAYAALQNPINAYFVARRNASREVRANAAPAMNEATPLHRAAIEPTTLNDATRFNPLQRRCMAIPRVRSAYTALQNPINANFVARRNASREARANAAPATNEATPLRRAAIAPTTSNGATCLYPLQRRCMAIPRVRSAYAALQNPINAYFVARRNASREARANAAPATNEATPLRRAAIEPTTSNGATCLYPLQRRCMAIPRVRSAYSALQNPINAYFVARRNASREVRANAAPATNEATPLHSATIAPTTSNGATCLYPLQRRCMAIPRVRSAYAALQNPINANFVARRNASREARANAAPATNEATSLRRAAIEPTTSNSATCLYPLQRQCMAIPRVRSAYTALQNPINAYLVARRSASREARANAAPATNEAAQLRRAAIEPTTSNGATCLYPLQRRCMAIPRVRSAYTALQNPINAYFVARRNESREVRANAAPATNEAAQLRSATIEPTTLNDATRFNPSQRRCMAIPRVRSAYTALQNPINAYFVARRNASREAQANEAPEMNEATQLRSAAIAPTTSNGATRFNPSQRRCWRS